MPADRSSTATLCSLAVIAFAAACVAHEAAGHGLACLGTGGTVTLLTSVYFRCRPSLPVIDAAGVLMNFAVAAVAALGLRRGSRSPSLTAFLGLLLAFSGFWGAGYLLFSALTNDGDPAFVVRDLPLQPVWLWRLGMGVVGVWLYALILRHSAKFLPRGRPLLAAYGAAGLVGCLSVLFYQGPTLPALKEALQESLLGPVGLLLAARAAPAPGLHPVPYSRGIVVAGGVITALFWLVLGRGIYGG